MRVAEEESGGSSEVPVDPYQFLRVSSGLLSTLAFLGLTIGVVATLTFFVPGRFLLGFSAALATALNVILMMALSQAIRLLFEIQNRIRDVQARLPGFPNVESAEPTKDPPKTRGSDVI